MTPEISVIIPTFNRQGTLPRALNSVISQTGVSFEILVIDDGSSDQTRQLVEKIFPQTSYFYQQNAGPSAARNQGILKSRGKWIAFLDSDDEWLPGKLAAQLSFFQNQPDYLIAQTEEIWIRGGKRVNAMKKHQKFGGWIYERCLPLCLISPSAVMIHRNLFDKVGLFDESLPACEDYDLWLRIAAQHPVGLLTDPYVIKYGGHEDQTSHKYPAMDQFRIQSLVKILNSKVLDETQTQATLNMLEEKSKIYIQGALKRGHRLEAEKVANLLRPFSLPRLSLTGVSL